MRLYHDSRSLDCRAPFGALPCGEIVRLRVYCDDSPRVVRAVIGREGVWHALPMQPDGCGAYDLRMAVPDQPGVVWYYFEAVDARGTAVYLGNAADLLGGAGEMRGDIPPAFQITVYARDYSPPAYLREGVLYQIFPDRFYRERVPARADAYIHENWDEPPLAIFDPRNGEHHAGDFFGGTLRGITQKLDYLRALGVTVLYLNPVFEARSNHRYDTGDYTKIDPTLGSREDFEALCAAAGALGIRVLLDGVFSHTGDDSVYFNKYGRYPGKGAYQGADSPYASWYTFRAFPDDYKCWWNVETLPELNKDAPSCREYFLGEQGVARRWLRAGASGWRLDVADELPMDYLRQLRQAALAQRADAALLGEVWEDASNKVAYGAMRCYCTGDTLDSVMNYPLREMAIAFVRGDIDAFAFTRRLDSLRENYPRPFFYSLMNLMGSHDRARILNVLAGECWEQVDPLDRGGLLLPPEKRALAVRRLRALWQIYAYLPGMPAIYYGDEAGMEGACDPFCRGTFPWGREDKEIFAITRDALALRRAHPVLRSGDVRITPLDRQTVRIRRFGWAGRDVFDAPLAEDDMEIIVSAVPE